MQGASGDRVLGWMPSLWAHPAPNSTWPWAGLALTVGAPGRLGHREGSEDRWDLPCPLPMLTSGQRHRDSEQEFRAGTPHLSPGATRVPWLRGLWATAPGGRNRGQAPGPGQSGPRKAFLRGGWAVRAWGWKAGRGAHLQLSTVGQVDMGITWGPAGGLGGRAFPRLVGVLERGVQLLEALLERVALVVLHQLLQDARAH